MPLWCGFSNVNAVMEIVFPSCYFKILTLAELNCTHGTLCIYLTEVGHRFSWVSTVLHIKDRQQHLWWTSSNLIISNTTINILNKTALSFCTCWQFYMNDLTVNELSKNSTDNYEMKKVTRKLTPLWSWIEWLPASNSLPNQSLNQLSFVKYLTPFAAGLSKCQGSYIAATTLWKFWIK